MPTWRLIAAAAALIAYALLSHRLMLHAAQAPWAVAALFGPLLLAVALASWLRRQWWVLTACAALVLLLALIVQQGGVQNMQRMYVLQHAGIHLALGWAFAVTLRQGSTPLITALAERVHQHFTPQMRAYTTWLTGLWVRYFVGMVLVSGLIYAFAPWAWWSAFCNLVTPVAAVALFVGEHVVRHWRHPEFERVSMSTALQAYQRWGREQAARRP